MPVQSSSRVKRQRGSLRRCGRSERPWPRRRHHRRSRASPHSALGALAQNWARLARSLALSLSPFTLARVAHPPLTERPKQRDAPRCSSHIRLLAALRPPRWLSLAVQLERPVSCRPNAVSARTQAFEDARRAVCVGLSGPALLSALAPPRSRSLSALAALPWLHLSSRLIKRSNERSCWATARPTTAADQGPDCADPASPDPPPRQARRLQRFRSRRRRRTCQRDLPRPRSSMGPQHHRRREVVRRLSPSCRLLSALADLALSASLSQVHLPLRLCRRTLDDVARLFLRLRAPHQVHGVRFDLLLLVFRPPLVLR